MLAIRFTLLLTIALVTGCATPSVLQQARTEYAGGEPFKALKTLEAADVAKRDSLLLLLDRGAIAFSAGQYAIAQRTLLDAHKLIEEWDQIRVSDQSASLVTNEWATRYRGEYSERLWINSYLMMVFLMQNNPESAAVEARRALKRLNANKKPLKIFEAAGAHDSAQVEYRKLSEDKGYDGRWNHAIERHTRRIGRKSFITKASDSFTRSTPKKLARDEGELILFLQSGSISPKLPGGLAIDIELNIAFPYYEEFEQSEPYYEVVVDGETSGTNSS